jgi:hypothetical protein
MLELGAIGPRFMSQGHQEESAFEIPVVVGRDIRDEVRGLIEAHEAIADREGGHLCIVGGVGVSIAPLRRRIA